MTIQSADANESTTMAVRPWYRRLLRMIWLYAGIPYLAVTVGFVMFQRHLMYRPTISADLSVATWHMASETARDVSIQTRDEKKLKGWLLRPSGDRAGSDNPWLVIYLPGNASNRFERLSDLLEFTDAGFDVLIFDYRGYGDSEGSPSQTALESDAKQIWQFAHEELGYSETSIVVFGESLGGAVALSLWSDARRAHDEPKPAAVILNSTFYSMPDVVGFHYPCLPFRYFLLDDWRSFERIGRVESPVIVFHGTADDFVPSAQGERLASLARHGRFIAIPGGTHNSIPMSDVRREIQLIRERISPIQMLE